MKYQILTAASPQELEKQVNEAIAQGLQPHGDVQVSRVFVAGTPAKEQHINSLYVQVVMEPVKKK